MSKMNEPELWDGTRMAQILGISGRRLRQLVEEGVLQPELVRVGNREVRRYEPVSTIRLYYEFILRSKKAPAPEEVEESRQRFENARADLTEAKAIAEQYKNDITTGKLLYAKDVEQDLKTFFVAFKVFALNLSKRAAGRFEGLVETTVLRQAEKELRDEAVDKLREFAAGGVRGNDDESA